METAISLDTHSHDLWQKLSNQEYRASFATLQLKRGVPFQIRAMMKKRGWTQEQLAESSGLTQGAISRAQNPDYGNLTINTISRIAAGFDVAFVGQFVPFSRLVRWFEEMSEEYGNVETFEAEYKKFWKSRSSSRRTRVRRRSVISYRPGTVPVTSPSAGTDQLKFQWAEIEPTRQSENIGKVLVMPARGDVGSANRIQAPAYVGQRLAGGL